MRVVAVLGLLCGLALATLLVLSYGVRAIWHAAAALGWGGLALVVAFHLALIVLMGFGWWLLGRGRADVLLWRLVWARLIRDSAAEALPFSQVGGFVLGARAAALAGVGSVFAAASTVVDVTAELFGQLLYTLFGLGLLAWLKPGSALVLPVLSGLAVMGVASAVFLAVQARGAGLIEQLVRRLARQFLGREAGSAQVQAAIQRIHARHEAMQAATLVHLATWVLAGVETWVTLRLMRVPIGLLEALTIDSLLYGLRSVAFMVPNALGVQEGGLVLLCGLFGVSPAAALGLSLIKRGRDLLIGVPALLVWQGIEGRVAAWRVSLTRLTASE